MTRFAIFLVLAIAVLAMVLLIAGQMGMLRGSAPTDLGVKGGKLKRPSKTENSVTSQADMWPEHPMQAYASIAPFKISGDGSAEMAKLASALQAMPGTLIVQQTGDYIYAQCTTQWLKFTDDVELYLDKTAGAIHMRSASRLGRKDFGVNRARVEALRQALAQN